MAAGLAGLLVDHALLSSSPALVVAQACAVALMVWARATLGRRSFHAAADPTAGGLVTSGPYRFIRHPVYTAACLFGCAGAAGNPSPRSALFCVLLIVGAVIRMLCEERLLESSYPEYREYARTTPRMVPFVF